MELEIDQMNERMKRFQQRQNEQDRSPKSSKLDQVNRAQMRRKSTDETWDKIDEMYRDIKNYAWQKDEEWRQHFDDKYDAVYY